MAREYQRTNYISTSLKWSILLAIARCAVSDSRKDQGRKERSEEGRREAYSHPTVKRAPLPLARFPVFLWIL